MSLFSAIQLLCSNNTEHCVQQKQANKTLGFTTPNSLESELCSGQFVGAAWCEGMLRAACTRLCEGT